MKKNIIYFLIATFFSVQLLCCNKSDGSSIEDITKPDKPSDTLYFPPTNGTAWSSVSVNSLGWNEKAVKPLLDFLDEKHTRSFMILVNGQIVIEKYFNGHSTNTEWEWNSAGKSLLSMVVGIAQQEGYLNIQDNVSKYLGVGWSSEPVEKETLIKIYHLLEMTSGLNDQSQLVIKPNLTYLADAGERWSYSNVFQLLMDVVSNACHQDFKDYCKKVVEDKIGMNGFWNFGLIFKIYHSDTRSMAKYGILALNKGKWRNEKIVDENFFNSSIQSSQNLNPAYGFLWWLNGKGFYKLPGGQQVYNGGLVPNAPLDMFAAMGAKDQRLYVIPSKKMVIVRMGEASDPLNPTFSLSGFDNALWSKINDLIL